jgi:glycine/D-amino acid oxidase-like deaminating enzyme
LRAAQEHFLPHEVLSSQQVAARYPAYRLPPESKSLYEQEGGVLAPERCIAAQLRLAQAHGARLVFGAKVTSWQVLPSFSGSGSSTGSNSSSSGSGGNQGLVQVCSSRGTFLARRLVLAAGAWTPALVPELASILEVERQVVGWFSVAPEKRHNFAAEASAAACASQHLWLVKEGTMAQRGKVCFGWCKGTPKHVPMCRPWNMVVLCSACRRSCCKTPRGTTTASLLMNMGSKLESTTTGLCRLVL